MKRFIYYIVIISIILPFFTSCQGDDAKTKALVDSLQKATADYQQKLQEKEQIIKNIQANEEQIKKLQDSVEILRKKKTVYVNNGNSNSNNSNSNNSNSNQSNNNQNGNQNVAVYSKLQKQIKELQQKNEDLSKQAQSVVDAQNKVNNLTGEINQLKSFNDQLNTKVSESEKEKSKAEDTIKRLKEQNKLSKGTLKVSDVSAKFFYKGLKQVAKNIKIVELCFYVIDNPNAEAGKKNLYITIYGPDNAPIVNKPENEFKTVTGVSTKYTYKEEMDYSKELKVIDKCCDWSTDDLVLVAGDYKVKIFIDGNIAGEGTFKIAQ